MLPHRYITGLTLCAALWGCGTSPTTSVDAQLADTAAIDATLLADVTASDAPQGADAPTETDVPAAEDVPMTAGPYPEGPYGSREGAVLANLEWEGYVNLTGELVSTEGTFGPTSLQDLRGDGRGYALIHLAEFL
jgi:hypothetical protein